MASYEDGRPLLPHEQHSQAHEDVSAINEAEDRRLLSNDDDDDDDGEQSQGFRKATSQTRKTGWFFASIFTMSVAAALALAGLLLSLSPSKPDTEPQVDEHSSPPKSSRPGDDYILDPDWDFSAPSQVREYEWTITDGDGSPDGVHRPMMLINDQFPGL